MCAGVLEAEDEQRVGQTREQAADEAEQGDRARLGAVDAGQQHDPRHDQRHCRQFHRRGPLRPADERHQIDEDGRAVHQRRRDRHAAFADADEIEGEIPGHPEPRDERPEHEAPVERHASAAQAHDAQPKHHASQTDQGAPERHGLRVPVPVDEQAAEAAGEPPLKGGEHDQCNGRELHSVSRTKCGLQPVGGTLTGSGCSGVTLARIPRGGAQAVWSSWCRRPVMRWPPVPAASQSTRRPRLRMRVARTPAVVPTVRIPFR